MNDSRGSSQGAEEVGRSTWERSGRIYIRPDANQPSTNAALAASGAAAVIGAILAGAISTISNTKTLWLIPVVVTIAIILLIPTALIFRRSIRMFALHDPSREITGYSYNLELGHLRKGNIDHWALRVEAVCAILDGLIMRVPQDQRKGTLYDLGYGVGETWTRDFMKEYALVGKGKISEEYPALFEQWSYYDATGGFGRFTFAVSCDAPNGTVLLYNSVLSRSITNYPLNHYFSGYIAGTINTLWERDKDLRGTRVSVELCNPSTKPQKIVSFDVRIIKT